MVDPDILLVERIPVHAPVTQSNRHQPTWSRAAGDVLEAEEGHPVRSAFVHAAIMPQREDRH
jgi:hypothetical protein